MIRKSAAAMIFSAALLLMTPAFAQYETVGGTFHAACSPMGGPAVTMLLDNNLQITVYGTVEGDEAYRTRGEVFEGERESIVVAQCNAGMENCKTIEGVLTAYKADGETIEAVLEYFDGKEVQGDSESIEGTTASFVILRDKNRAVPVCG